MSEQANAVARAAEVIASADALLVGAGAGMGVDSGLPDFRGDQGFWEAYPPMAKLGIRFVEMANPRWFVSDPDLAWGFYGHRLNLYRATMPHAGFELLRRWGEAMPRGVYAFSSNVDGQFQAAGFGKNVVECHGSLHHLQCSRGCGAAIWSAAGVEVQVDEKSFRAAEPFPACPHCGAVARPNVLMFGDAGWIGDRTERQESRYGYWLEAARGGNVVVVECGAGTAVPTVRWQCEQVAAALGGTLIRINPREPRGPAGCISIPAGALESLQAIQSRMGSDIPS